MNKKKELSEMEKLTQGYEKFMNDKEAKKGGKQVFDKIIKKASKPKPRSSK